MARMYGAFDRAFCPKCRTDSGPDCAHRSRGKRGQRWVEERQWRSEVEQDVLDVMEEVELLHFVEATWLPDWYIEKLDPVWVRLWT